MAQWQAPSTNNERDVNDIAVRTQGIAIPYLAADGNVRWWSGSDALPAGSTRLYVVVRAGDNVRIFSDDNASERAPYLFGTSIVHFR
jgi:hypothetical protein